MWIINKIFTWLADTWLNDDCHRCCWPAGCPGKLLLSMLRTEWDGGRWVALTTPKGSSRKNMKKPRSFCLATADCVETPANQRSRHPPRTVVMGFAGVHLCTTLQRSGHSIAIRVLGHCSNLILVFTLLCFFHQFCCGFPVIMVLLISTWLLLAPLVLCT